MRDARVVTEEPSIVAGVEPSLDAQAGTSSQVQQTRAAADPWRVRLQAVTKEFRRGSSLVHALGPVDLQVRDGEFVSVVGPSGCGKSTLLRIIAGLAAPTGGEVDLVRQRRDRPLLALVPQQHGVFPWKTVEENIRFGLDTQKRIPKPERRAIVDRWLERLGLSHFREAYPETLSGGMRQRVAIGRALAVEPEMLLMDEPFASLDAQLRHMMQNELLDLWQQDQRTVVFITHSIEEALLLSDRVLVSTARPGIIKASFEVPFPRPRDESLRSTPDFVQLRAEIHQLVKDEVNLQMAQTPTT